jgi:hypothetical protein
MLRRRWNFSRESVRWQPLVLLLLGLSACEGDCRARHLVRRWSGAKSPDDAAAPWSTRDQGMDLTGTDCSDGLLRCVDGVVEASRRAHLPNPCGPGPENQACRCPWDVVTRCFSGCAAEGLEVLGEAADGGAAQLCRPDLVVARPILPGDAVSTDICSDEGIACVDGVVRGCEGAGRPSQAYALCLDGCEPRVAVGAFTPGNTASPGTNKTLDGVVAILCRRAHAERR